MPPARPGCVPRRRAPRADGLARGAASPRRTDPQPREEPDRPVNPGAARPRSTALGRGKPRPIAIDIARSRTVTSMRYALRPDPGLNGREADSPVASVDRKSVV